jgi:hypothetical protein
MGSKLLEYEKKIIDKKKKISYTFLSNPIPQSYTIRWKPYTEDENSYPFLAQARYDVFQWDFNDKKRKLHRQKRKISSTTTPYTFLSNPIPPSYTIRWKPYTDDVKSYPLLAQARYDVPMGFQRPKKENFKDFNDKKRKLHRQKRKISSPTNPYTLLSIPIPQSYTSGWNPYTDDAKSYPLLAQARYFFKSDLNDRKKKKFHQQKRKISSPTNPYTLLSIPMPQSYTSGWKPYTNVATSYPLLAHSRDNFETPKIDNVPDLNDQRRKFQYQHPCPLPIAGNQFFSTIFGLTRH